MDLKKNIEIAATCCSNKSIDFIEGFLTGAESQQAKEYWFAEFKREEVSELTPQEKIGFTHHDSRIGIIGHGPSLGCELQARQYEKQNFFAKLFKALRNKDLKL